MARQNSAKRYAKREAKKFARKNAGFVVALILSIILGVALGFGSVYLLGSKDEFTLYNEGKAMTEATVRLNSGETYDLEADENETKVVVWGNDVSSYVKHTIKYINLETEEVEIVDEFSKDGTYCVIYELNYTGNNFLVKIGMKKYENVKLRKTIIIGGNE
jgi:hypothetical protein